MQLLWFTWKDPSHPLAGGAELVQQQLTKRLIADGHDVTIVCGAYEGAAADKVVDGCRVIRMGNRYTVHFKAMLYYRKHLRGWADVVIDEVNTAPFFAKFYVREPHIAFFHQLAREIWFYEMPFPLDYIGYVVEPIYIRLLSGQRAITVSNSTRDDLIVHGFKPRNISVISEGILLQPVKSLSKIEKFDQPTLLSFGAFRKMKRTLDTVKAFELAKEEMPDLQLKLAGDASSKYGQDVLSYIEQSPYRDDIEYLGRVTDDEKTELMRRSHAILVASVREGWGLIVTEANSQGTPAVVYDVSGLRDSVKADETGEICDPHPGEMALGIVKLLQDKDRYRRMQAAGYKWSKQITFDQCYKDFKKAIGA